MEHDRTAKDNNEEEEIKVVPLVISTEEILEQSIGHLNCTQILQSTLTSLSPFLESLQTFISIYAHAQPTWHCTTHTPLCSPNKSNQCNLPRNTWEWDSPPRVHTSIISEWNLECATSFITGLPGTSYFAGCLLGGLLLATLGDSSLGRKNLLCLSSLILYLAGLASAFAPNIWVYSVLRFLSGIGRAPLPMCAIILFTERVSKKWRSQIVMLGFISSSLGLLVLTGIAYIAKDSSWRILYLYTSIPGLIFTVISYFFMYESPRWLLLQGRDQDAINVLKSLGGPKTHQMSPSLNIIIKYTQQQKGVCTISTNPYASLKILIGRSWAAKRLMASMLLAFGIGLMYFGMFLGVGSLGSNIYTTSVYHSLLSLSSSFLAFLYWIPKCNRRISLIGYCSLSGGMSIALSILGRGRVNHEITLGMELVSMFSACMAYNMVMLYIIELFPTCVRSSASQLVRQATNLGTVLDPILVLLGSGNMIYSYGVFGLAMLLCGFLVIWLPETRGKVLCDTMEEQEVLDKGMPNQNTLNNHI
ncbi:organic cation/carnitine transporter 2-like [Amaranthus tricolor]|uniref:organic cation/carnitine transporter 2-like n=1 Tax=Amaranthus tricolor TaxID=29722 RepID=UPI002588BA5A|nr:organic cation/carnitine transporter 2-like [Amaranthus tricolor]